MINAIETQYKGYRFRSRLEARWAVFFDALNMSWEYEFEGIELDNGVYYLPDFWIPYVEEWNFTGFSNPGNWIEIKGINPSKDELDKLVRLARVTNHTSQLLVGVPGKQERWFAHRSGNFGHLPVQDWGFPWCTPHEYGLYLAFHQLIDEEHSHFDNIRAAIVAARSARFEFGEMPNYNYERTNHD